MASNKSKTPGPIQVVVVLMLTVLAFYFGNRFGQVFDFNTMEITDGALATVNSIVAAPAAISMASVPMLYAIGLAITVLIVWLYTFMYAGNYRYGEEAGSAKWGTLKEGIAFKDQTDPSNNLLFTKNYGLALKKPKFDLEHDRNLNVMVIGGSGSGKTRNYVKPNLMQLNASYFLTDPKGTSLSECGYLFRDNGYRIKVFNTIEFNKSMHYNPLKYVKTDADILSFVNCLISNTNGDKQSGGDPFWENSERLLYTALIALLRDWFPPEDYSLDGLLTLLSMAEAKENDENFKSPLDMIFDEIETGKVYERNPFYQGPSTSSSYADAESDRMAISENTTDEFTWQSSLMERNNDGLSPAREGGLTSDQDFALANYKMFKVAAGKTLKSIIISCNVRMAPMRIEQVRELLKYDEMNLDEMGDPGQRTAVFAIMSDTDKTFSFLHAIMMWQSIDILCRRALEKYNGKLPTMVNFIFDEFANIGTIPDIEQTIAVTRSRNIGTLKLKRIRGKYTGSVLPYGYRPDPDDINCFIIDPVAASVVRRIWEMHAGGIGAPTIARTLNEEGIPNPTSYAKLTGYSWHNRPSSSLWSAGCIYSILHNETYLGTLCQGRQLTPEGQFHSKKNIPKDQWVRTVGHHPAIIDDELLRRELKARKEAGAHNLHEQKKNFPPGIFGKEVRCASCGKILTKGKTLRKTGYERTLFCPTRKKSPSHCKGAFISEKHLESAILHELKNLADRYSDDRVQIGICQDAQSADLIQERNRLKTAVELIEKEITAYEQRSRDLYLKRATDGMSIDDFNSALSRIRNDVDKLRLKSKRASSELLHLNESIAAESIRMETVLKAADFNHLDKTKVSMLIESVYVHKRDPKSGTQAIDITWKF